MSLFVGLHGGLGYWRAGRADPKVQTNSNKNRPLHFRLESADLWMAMNYLFACSARSRMSLSMRSFSRVTFGKQRMARVLQMPLVQSNSLHNGFLAGLVGCFVGGVTVNTFTHTTCQHGHKCHTRGLVNGSLRKRLGTWHLKFDTKIQNFTEFSNPCPIQSRV
jgi:hypothetical protein